MPFNWRWPWSAGRRQGRGNTPDPITPAPATPGAGEYEDRYPEAYGHGEAAPSPEERRHYTGFGVPRQVRDSEPAVAAARDDQPAVVNIQEPTTGETRPGRPRPPPARHAERPRRPLVERTPQQISGDVAEALAASPFIDASDIAITVDGSEVRLGGTVNSLIAISLAQALASNVPGVSRVEVQLRVRQAPHHYETVPGDGDFTVRKR